MKEKSYSRIEKIIIFYFDMSISKRIQLNCFMFFFKYFFFNIESNMFLVRIITVINHYLNGNLILIKCHDYFIFF